MRRNSRFLTRSCAALAVASVFYATSCAKEEEPPPPRSVEALLLADGGSDGEMARTLLENQRSLIYSLARADSKASELLAFTFAFSDVPPATPVPGAQFKELNYLQTLASGLPTEVLRATGFRVSVYGIDMGIVTANLGETKRLDTYWKLIDGKWKATSMRVAMRDPKGARETGEVHVYRN